MQNKNSIPKSRHKISLLVLILISIFSNAAHSQTIYSLKVDSIVNSKTIPFSNFQGKKILFVNAAILDTAYYQWRELKQLQTRYQNNLVIVITPFNNFSNQTITDFFQPGNYSFVISKKVNTYSSSDSLYEWLSKKSLNGLRDSYVNVAFQKYLINENGYLVAVFTPKTSPLSKTIIDAIEL